MTNEEVFNLKPGDRIVVNHKADLFYKGKVIKISPDRVEFEILYTTSHRNVGSKTFTVPQDWEDISLCNGCSKCQIRFICYTS